MDCDPGVDDLFAMLLCLWEPSLKLLGVSASTGNSSARNTAKNCLKILNRVDRLDVPVVQGATHPMTSEKFNFAEEFHGKDGLAVDWPLPEQYENLILSYNFPEQIYRRIREHHEKTQEKVTMLITGPCTNIALVLKIFPDVTEFIKEVVVMGGALDKGNVTAHAEYNIWSDPEAADVLLRQKGLNINMVGLEATHKVCVDQCFLDKFKTGEPTAFKDTLLELLTNFGKAYQQHEGFEFPPCHDYLTLFFLTQRRLFNGVFNRYQVDCTASRKGKVLLTEDHTYN